ncbi:MAG: DJ-1/PfpI family protein [Firmicutes bacterium]|nr:DJ-1/PfpI family protein [Bacillota bacterium]
MRVDVVVFDGVDELDAVGPYEVLARAGKEEGWRVRLAVLPGRRPTVRGRHGLILRAHGRLSAAPDVLVVPGGGWVDPGVTGIRAEIAAGELVRAVAERAPGCRLVAAVCTGAMVLAAAGLLRGRAATTHHAALADLAAAGARVRGGRVVRSGRGMTAGGVSSGIDLGLRVVEDLAGPDRARAVAAQIEHGRRAAWRAPTG